MGLVGGLSRGKLSMIVSNIDGYFVHAAPSLDVVQMISKVFLEFGKIVIETQLLALLMLMICPFDPVSLRAKKVSS